MLIPPVMPRAGTITMPGGKPADYYEISMRQFSQQILPAGLPATTVWGYGAVKSASRQGPAGAQRALAHDRVEWNRPVRIKWINELVDANGNYLPHLLPVDPTLHWANPPGGCGAGATCARRSRDARALHRPGADRDAPARRGRGRRRERRLRRGLVPAGRRQHPGRLRHRGHLVRLLRGQGGVEVRRRVGPGFATFQYPNDQRESTLWYHDHALGMTRLNVYAGPAGFFLVRGGPEGDKAVLDSRTGTTAVLPSPAPNEGDMFPPNKTYYEIPIASRTARSTPTARCSTRTRGRSSTGSSGDYIPDGETSRRSGTPSSSAT